MNPVPSPPVVGPVTAPAPSRQLFWRVLFVGLIAGWLTFFAFHPHEFFHLGIQRFQFAVAPDRVADVWFLDSYALLASNDAVSAHRDPYAPNPLDYLQRPHIYGPWWLHLRDLGLTRADNFRVGLALGATFLLAALAWLRPRDAGSLRWFLAILGSIPVLLALERANNDLAIFLVLAPVVPCLLSGHAALRWLAVGLVALAADLKFYPAVAALLLLTTAPARELRWRLAVGVGLLALVAWHVAGGITRIAPSLPAAQGVFTFGATSGFRELGWGGPWPQLLAVALGVILLAGCWRTRLLGDWCPAPAQRREWLHFVLGATLLAGCFFAGQNFAYRWVFALWLAPLLWSLPRDAATPAAVRRLAGATGWLLLAALWFDPVCTLVLSQLPGIDLARALHWVFLVEQPFVWALAACLLVFLAHFARGGVRALTGRDTAA